MLVCWIGALFGITKLPGKIHIHHAYFGIILLIIWIKFPLDILFILGIALIVSDLFDHLFFIKLRTMITKKLSKKK